MYGSAGERRLTEYEAPWLPGYEGSRPVRIGNAAVEQFQLDVYGEVHRRRCTRPQRRAQPDSPVWTLQRALIDFLEQHWREPDEGIWEVRGPRRHFTHSKVMAWVAFDRAITVGRAVRARRRRSNAGGRLRDEIHAEVCAQGFDARARAFTQYYGADELDASLLLIPWSASCPPTIRASSAPSTRSRGS